MSPERARITRKDIEDKIRSLTGDVEEQVSDARPVLIGTGAGAAVLLLLLAYLLGRRSGRRRSAVVEIRRA